MNEHELGDVFERVLPEQPSAKGWAAAVRRRRQRTRTIAGAAAVTVVAAVAIPLGLSLGSGPQAMTTPAPTATEDVETADGGVVPSACLEAQEEHFDLEGTLDGKLPTGATRLWLCGSDTRIDHDDQLTFVGPQEELTTGVDDAVATFNDLEWQEGAAIDCASNGEVYHLLVDYPDGTRRSVTGNFSPDGCQHFDTHDGIVEGANDYLGTLQDLWEAQRASQQPVLADVDLCPGATSVFTVAPAVVRSGLGCVVQRGDAETRIRDDLPRELLTPILEGISAGGEPVDRYEPYGSDQQVVLFNDHGDPVTLHWGKWEGATGFAWNNPERVVWHPNETFALRIDDYFEQVVGEPEPGPSGTPTLGAEDDGGLTSKVCDDIQSGAVEPEHLPASDMLSTGAERVWLCGDLKDPFGGALGPREPLVTDPDRVVETVNALAPGPEGEVACTAIGGLTYHLAIDYPGGERRIISAETVNCSWVGGWGGRVGGGELLEEIQPMWFAQRAAQGPPDLGDPRLCDSFTSPTNWEGGYESFLYVTPSDAVRGAVCGLAGDAVGFHGEVRQVRLPQELVAAIAEAEPLVESPPQLGPRGLPYLVLLNEFGDPMTVPMLSMDQLLLPEGVWTPGEEAAKLLRQSVADLRLKAFYEEPADCTKYVEGEAPADLGDVVSGAACVQAFAVPAKGPELDPDFAQELARRFQSESVPMSWGTRSSSVVLRDADGRRAHLYYDNRNHFDATLPAGLVNEKGDRVWELPDDVRAELELHGFDFTQQ